MNHNVLVISDYRDDFQKPHSRYLHRKPLRSQICFWISYVVDTVSTIAITGCTIFCCYLAFTML